MLSEVRCPAATAVAAVRLRTKANFTEKPQGSELDLLGITGAFALPLAKPAACFHSG